MLSLRSLCLRLDHLALAVADRNLARFHGLGKLSHEIDVQETVLEARALNRHMVGELEAALEGAGMKPTTVDTAAHCTIEKDGAGFSITTMKLDVVADVPGADRDAFKDIAEQTLTGCPVSKALMGNVKLEMDARLA